MEYKVPEYLIRLAEMYYGKVYVKRCLEKEIVKKLIQSDVELALAEHFNLDENGQTEMSSKTLHVMSIVGNIKYNSKVSKETIALVTNPYFVRWALTVGRGDIKEVFPHNTYSPKEVDKAIKLLHRKEFQESLQISGQRKQMHNKSKKGRSKTLNNFIKAMNIEVDTEGNAGEQRG